jgi:ABC-type Mn2+/Zn2+ transport system permease subunit
MNLLFLVLLALAVAIGVKVVETLLMGSLLIIPASAASDIARSLKGLTTLSILFAVLSTVIGILTAYSIHVSHGPLVVVFRTSPLCFDADREDL